MPRILNVASSKSTFTIRAKSKDTAEMLVYGVVGGDGFWEEGITAKQVHTQLKELDKGIKNLDLRINSVGGSVFEGFAIYNLLKQSGLKVTTYVDGLAASIASVIALAGSKVIMGAGSQMMIHKAWTIAAGNSADFENIIDRLNTIDDQLIKTYASKTGKNKAEIQGLVHAETWFTAEQAIEFGLADEMSEETFAIAASFLDKATWVKKFPKNIVTQNAEIKANVLNLKKDLKDFLTARK